MTEINRVSEAKAILRNYHALVERQYKGDTDAICTLVDLADAIGLARLTDRQTEALRLVYGADMTQKSAGERMGIGQNTVSELIADGIERIDDIYEMLAWLDGELTPSDFIEEEESEGIAV